MSECKCKSLAAKARQWYQWKGLFQGGKGRSTLKSRGRGASVEGRIEDAGEWRTGREEEAEQGTDGGRE